MGHVELELQSTHDAQLMRLEWWQGGGFTVMPQSRRVVMNDVTNNTGVFKVYKMLGLKLRVDKTINVPCEHDDTRLLGLMINKQEFLAVSCSDCLSIHLFNLETEQVTHAYSGEWVYGMCHGREGRMFVSLLGSDKVMELDCSTSRFTHKNTIHTGLKLCNDLCYLPPPHDCVVVCGVEKFFNDPHEARAVSCRDGSVVWGVQGEVDGKRIHPWRLLLVRGSVLVADAGNKRILVLDPKDGSFIKTIQSPGVGNTLYLDLCDAQIVMLHRTHTKWNISFFDVK